MTSIVNRAGFRTCEIDGVKHASIIDFITAFGKDGCHARVIWKRMKDDAAICYRYNMMRFAGQTSASPVADAVTLLQILSRLSGPSADKLRLAGTQGLISVLDTTRDSQYAVTDAPFQASSVLVDGGDAEIRMAPHVYNQTWLYVRVCLPVAYSHYHK